MNRFYVSRFSVISGSFSRLTVSLTWNGVDEIAYRLRQMYIASTSSKLKARCPQDPAVPP
jgi:hypothetical protein